MSIEKIHVQVPEWMKRKSQPRPKADGRSAHKIVVIDGKPTLALSTEKPPKETNVQATK